MPMARVFPLCPGGVRVPCLPLLVALALVAALCGPAAADRVITKKGATFVGTVVQREGGRIVIRTTGGGQVTVKEADVRAIEKTDEHAPASADRIVPASVKPGEAKPVFKEAGKAFSAGKWKKAGEQYAGVLAIRPPVLQVPQRTEAAEKLVVCHLQLSDAGGAAVALRRRAGLARSDDARKRILAVIDALQGAASKNLAGGKAPKAFDPLVDAAALWKAGHLVEEARQMAAATQTISVRGRLGRQVRLLEDTLREADFFKPGAYRNNRDAVLKVLADKVMDIGRKTASRCEQERRWLNGNRWRSWAAKEIVQAWTGRVMAYMSAREQAEDALKNLLATDALRGLYNEGEARKLLKQLDGLQYYPGGKLRIVPRKTGQ